jgi:hypothetical protein
MCTLISNPLVCSYTIIVTTYGLRKDCIKFEGLYGLQVDCTPKLWPLNELQFYSRMCRWNINGLYNPELSTVWTLNGLYSAYRLHGYHKWTGLVPLNQINQLAMDFTSIQVLEWTLQFRLDYEQTTYGHYHFLCMNSINF